jgi:type II secretory pathway component PulF
MVFQYQALNEKGENVADYIDAPSESAARQKLRSQGLYVVRMRKHEIAPGKESPHAPKGFLARAYHDAVNYIGLKMSARQVGIFSRQLSTLLTAGMPLIATLNAIIEQIDTPELQAHRRRHQGEDRRGLLVFQRAPAPQSDLFRHVHQHGTCRRKPRLARPGDRTPGRHGGKAKPPQGKSPVRALVSVVHDPLRHGRGDVLMVKIVPSLSRMFMDMGRELPLPTRIVMGVSDFLSTFWYLLIIIAVLVIYYLRQYISTAEGRRKFDGLKLTLPLFKNLYHKLIVLRFTQNLGVLLNNRVDILKSFEIVKKIVGNVIIERR